MFQQTIPITQGTPITLKLFFELRGLITLMTNASTFSDTQCFAPSGSTSDGATPYFCGNTVYLAGTVESDTPDLHRYLVTSTTPYVSANVFGIYFKKGTKEPVGAYNLGFYDPTYQDGSEFNHMIKSVASAGSNALEIHTYGGSTSVNEIDDLPGAFNTSTFPY